MHFHSIINWWCSFQIYKSNLYGKRFVWIHYDSQYGILDELTASDDVTESGCTTAEVVAAGEGMMVLRAQSRPEADYDSVIGEHGMVRHAMF